MNNELEKQDSASTGLRTAVDTVLAHARRGGASAAEADAGSGRGLTVMVRQGEVESVEHQRDKSLSVTVYFDGRKGSASTTDFSDRALAETTTAACTIARYGSEDPCAGLIDPRYLAQQVPDLDLNHPWRITPDEAMQLAIDCERHAREFDERITNADGTMLTTYAGSTVYGNSHGFINGWEWSSHSLDCTVIAEDAAGMQRDGWYSRARDHHELENARSVGLRAAQRTVSRLGSRRLSTRRAPVIFEAPVARSLFGAFTGAIAGTALYRKASFLLDRLGEPVFAPTIRIHESPHVPRGMGSAPFDDDGMATAPRDIVRDGVLRGYVLSAYSARRLGMEPTGNAGGVHNLIVDHGDQDLDALLKTMGTGLLITDLMGFGVNQITGDYSRGASGYWVEGGEIRHPVEEITVAGNLKDMYRNIAAVGRDVDRRGNIQTGSVLIDGMSIAGE